MMVAPTATPCNGVDPDTGKPPSRLAELAGDVDLLDEQAKLAARTCHAHYKFDCKQCTPIDRTCAPAHFRPTARPQQPYPIDALPDLMRHAVEGAMQLTERPAPMSATIALVCAAATFQLDYRVASDRFGAQPISLFGVCAAAPGNGKTETAKRFLSPFRGQDAILAERFRAANPEKPMKLECPDVVADDYTIESLAHKLTHGRPAMMQFMGEAAQLVHGWSGGDGRVFATLSKYAGLWDGAIIDVGRRRDGGTYKSGSGRQFSKMLLGQGMMIDWIFSPAAVYGYTARLLIVKDDGPTLRYDGELTDAENSIGAFNRLIRDALKRQNEAMEFADTPMPETHNIRFQPDAWEMLESLRIDDSEIAGVNLLDDENHLPSQWQQRRAQHAARIAAVLCAVEHGSNAGDGLRIDGPVAERGITLANWYWGELTRLYDTAGQTETTADAQRAWQIIAVECPQSDAAQLRKMLAGKAPFRKDAERRERAIDWLQTEGAIIPVPGERGVWQVAWK